MTVSTHTTPALQQWQAFTELLHTENSDLQPVLQRGLAALVELWGAQAGAISCQPPGGRPLGVRVGTLPAAAQQRIASEMNAAAATDPTTTTVGDTTLVMCPLALHGATVGRLYLVVSAPPPAAELEFAACLLSQAVVRASTAEQLRRDLRELGLIANITHTLNTTLNLQTLLQSLIADTRTLLTAESASVLLLDTRRNELVFEVTEGVGTQPTFMRMPMHQGIAGAVVQTGQAQLIADARRDPRFFGGIDQMTGSQTRTLLAVPLQGRSGVIGVLEALNRRDGQPFDGHDLELATILAGQAAVSVENARLYEELQAERDRLVRREAEVRAQIGRDLHDGPVQQVAAAGMHINFLRTLLKRAPEQVPEALDDLDVQLKQATSDLRTVLYELRPLGIEEEGLYVVLGRYVAKFRNPDGMHLHLDVPANLRRLPPNRETPTLIIIQEAINNARKHAQAADVQITLRDEGATLLVTVADNGRGFDVAALEQGYVQRGSFGLLNMRERAELIGGSWQITSALGAGTTVTLHIPFDSPSETTGLATDS